MPNTYFEYTLSKCKSHLTKNVCARYSSLTKLLKSPEEEWGEYKRIKQDYELLDAIEGLLGSEELCHETYFTGDSLSLYNRCKTTLSVILLKWKKRENLEYDSLFDALTELCWLLASALNSKQCNKRYVVLLSDPNQINDSIKTFLDNVYSQAVNAHNETVYITEGIDAKKEHKWIPALYDNEFRESDKYIQSVWSIKELEKERALYKQACSSHLALYYGLTATAVLAYNYQRGYY